MIPIYKTYLNSKILSYAHDALDSGWISSHGKYKKLASDMLCEVTNTKYSYLTCNGTSACHLMARAISKFHNKRRTVAVLNNCYVAAWNTFLYEDHFKLIPVEPDEQTWNMPVRKYNEDIIYVVHNLGNIVNVPELKRLNPDSIIIEDACEAMFGEYEDNPAGSLSTCSTFSFFGNKNISSGEGGAVVTNNEEIYKYVKHLAEQAQTEETFLHDELAYNYRMSNPHAAILYGQLQHYDVILKEKQRIFELYDNLLDGFESQVTETNTKHSCWMYGVKFKTREDQGRAKSVLASEKIEIRPMFLPMNKHPHLKHMRVKSNIATKLNEVCLVLPSYPSLKEEEIKFICSLVKKESYGKT